MHKNKSSNLGGVLLLGNYRPSVTIARELAPLGHKIYLGMHGEEHGVRFSRFVGEVWKHCDLNVIEQFEHELHEYLVQNPDIRFVMPVTEEFVTAFATKKIVVPNGVTLVSPQNDVIDAFSDKVGALQLAKRVGVSLLPFAIASNYSQLVSDAEAVGYPITVRPLGTTARLANKKALIFSTSTDLEVALPCWPNGHRQLLLQRYAHGVRHNVYFAARGGELIAVCESKIHRTNDVDGTGLAVDGQTIKPTPKLIADTQKLLSATNYTGIGLAQFIVCPKTGKSCFLELNPRVSGSHAVPERAGVPLSRLALDLAVMPDKLEHIPKRLVLGRQGIRYAWTSGDLFAAKMLIINRELPITRVPQHLLAIVRTFLSANMHMIWRWDDPLPGLVAVLSCLPRFAMLRRSLGMAAHSKLTATKQ